MLRGYPHGRPGCVGFGESGCILLTFPGPQPACDFLFLHPFTPPPLALSVYVSLAVDIVLHFLENETSKKAYLGPLASILSVCSYSCTAF
jgi:hypothetical protein